MTSPIEGLSETADSTSDQQGISPLLSKIFASFDNLRSQKRLFFDETVPEVVDSSGFKVPSLRFFSLLLQSDRYAAPVSQNPLF
jgi:hypothetical protein